MTKTRTIFITVFHSFITKNILNTDVFSIVTADKSIQFILLVPDTKYDFFKDTYSKENVEVVAVKNDVLTKTRTAKFFSIWSHLLIDSHYLWYKRRERLETNKTVRGFLKYGFEMTITKLISGRHIMHPLFRKLFLEFGRQSEIKLIFDKYSPDCVFSTDAFDESDVLFAGEAKRRGIKLISMVRSWDNCFSKGLLRVIPDKLIVNNETLKEEAVSFHDVSSENVAVLGSPQYDNFTRAVRTPREQFFKQTNLDPNKKLIIFAPAGAILSDTDWQIATVLKEAVESNQFIFPVQFLVRNHPNHPADLSAIKGRADMVIENPGKVFNKQNPKETELTKNDSRHLADELYYADTVVWVATTLGLDSIIFNKPQIVINFDGWEKNYSYIHSVKRYHSEDHMKKMLNCGGVTVAKSKQELIDSINHYLKDPSWNQEGRDKVKKQQFYKLDGKAGKRIGEFILANV